MYSITWTYYKKAINEFATNPATVGDKFISEDWEWFDVTIRCYLLGSVISDVLDEMEENGDFDESQSTGNTKHFLPS